MSYLEASEYEGYTGRDESEAEDYRINMASRLLDARIGNHRYEEDSEFKLDIDGLPKYQQEAVKNWVAWMVAGLEENNDSIESTDNLTLGRFSVSKNEDSTTMPDQLKYADQILKTTGVIKLGVKYTNSPTTGVVINE